MALDSEIIKFPSLVAITVKSNPFNHFTSSGFIIDSDWIVCNGCIVNSLLESKLEFRYGATDKFELENPTLDISDIHVHPSFSDTNLSHNIALLKLAKPFEFNENVQPIMLPWKYKNKSLEQFRPFCVSLVDDDVKPHCDIVYGKSQIISNANCDKIRNEYGMLERNLRDLGVMNLDNKMYRDAPIVFPGSGLIHIEDNDEQILMGLDVFHEIEPKVPSVFSNLSEHLDWIEGIIVFENF